MTPVEPFAPRATPRVERPPRDPASLELARRERMAPRLSQWDHLHLLRLRAALAAALAPLLDSPVLDLWCGTKPYRPLVPADRVVGLDIDLHFGSADVLGTLPLPFRDGAFAAALSTQALHLVDDPVATVGELRRVLAPGGRVVVTVPRFFFRGLSIERHWQPSDLRALFGGWDEVAVVEVGGVGTNAAFAIGRVADAARSRVRALAPLAAAVIPLGNALGVALDVALRPLASRYPNCLLLTARRPR